MLFDRIILIDLNRPRLAESKRNQARAKQDKTGNGYGQETVRSEFVTHD